MKNVFFNKILKKPLILIVLISLWPLLTYFIPARLVTYLPFFYAIQIILILNYIRLYIKYLRYIKFPNYEEARLYYYDLGRVKKLELKAKKAFFKKAAEEMKLKIQKEKEEKRVQEEKLKEEALKKLKIELEERKKKVL
jgi:hypothetical protein